MANLAAEAVARLQLTTHNASSNSQGFIANQVVTEGYIQANSGSNVKYEFCLREIDMSTDEEQVSGFSTAELISIIGSDGCDLAMMPLVKFNSDPGGADAKKKSINAIDVVKKMQSFALPIDITIWFDDSDFKAAFPGAADRDNMVSGLASAGYSIGYYGGEGCECSPSNSAMQNGSTVLNAVSCGTSSVPSKTFPTVTIGDNSNACKIRWVSSQ